MARRPRRTTVDPFWLQDGALLDDSEHIYDEYFKDDEASPPVLGLVMDRLLERLEPHHRTAVELTVIAGMSYGEAGDVMGHDKKTVWRWCQKGLSHIADRLSAPWASALLIDHVAIDGPDIPSYARTFSDALDEASGTAS